MKRFLISFICVLLLVLSACRMNVKEHVAWPENEWTKDIPKFSDEVDALFDSSKNGKCDMAISMQEVSYAEYCTYIGKLEDAGFADDYEGQLIPEKEPNSYASFLSSNMGIMIMVNWYSENYPARPLCDMQIQIQTLEENTKK